MVIVVTCQFSSSAAAIQDMNSLAPKPHEFIYGRIRLLYLFRAGSRSAVPFVIVHLVYSYLFFHSFNFITRKMGTADQNIR